MDTINYKESSCNKSVDEFKKFIIQHKIDMLDYSIIMFRYAVENNNLPVMEWIYSISDNLMNNLNIKLPRLLIAKCMQNRSWNSLSPIDSIYIQQKSIRILDWLYKFYKNDIFDYFALFCNICHSGNLLIAQWLYSKYKYEIRLNRLNLLKEEILQQDILLKIIESTNVEILIWLDVLNIKFTNRILNIGFNYACMYNNLSAVKWFLNKKVKYYIQYYVLDMILVKNNIELVKILSGYFSNYCYKIVDNKIISHKFISKTIKDNILNNEKYIIKEKVDDCMICIENTTYHIKLECKHMYCRDCYIELNKCPMCMKKINKTNIILIKNE
jgi:hypothetical protein